MLHRLEVFGRHPEHLKLSRQRSLRENIDRSAPLTGYLVIIGAIGKSQFPNTPS
jgi:hypothetical protein